MSLVISQLSVVPQPIRLSLRTIHREKTAFRVYSKSKFEEHLSDLWASALFSNLTLKTNSDLNENQGM